MYKSNGMNAGHESCGAAMVLAGMSLLFLLVAVFIVRRELAAMRTLNYVRCKIDGRTGVATPPDRYDEILVRWDDDGTRSDREAAGGFETLSFEAHVAARSSAP